MQFFFLNMFSKKHGEIILAIENMEIDIIQILIESNPVNTIMVTNIVFLVVSFWNVAFYQCSRLVVGWLFCRPVTKWYLIMAISFDPFV